MKDRLKYGDYTGEYYFVKRLFGGYTIKLKCLSAYVDVFDSHSPEFELFKTATPGDLTKFEFNLLKNAHKMYTGNIIIYPQIFGGFNIKVEIITKKYSNGSYAIPASTEHRDWRNADMIDLSNFELKLK